MAPTIPLINTKCSLLLMLIGCQKKNLSTTVTQYKAPTSIDLWYWGDSDGIYNMISYYKLVTPWWSFKNILSIVWVSGKRERWCWGHYGLYGARETKGHHHPVGCYIHHVEESQHQHHWHTRYWNILKLGLISCLPVKCICDKTACLLIFNKRSF